MLTARGFWFLFAGVLVLFIGLFARQPALTLMGLSVGLWFGWEWLMFLARLRGVQGRLRVVRQVRDERGPVAALWSGRTFEVRAAVALEGPTSLPYAAVSERIPFGVEAVDGATAAGGPLAEGEPLGVSYRIRCPSVGQVRFEGLRLRLADLQGFFYAVAFVPGVKVYRVLPALVDHEGRAVGVKRHNRLPPPGVHRLRRPGSGSELLDLRDYLPGDPPRTISWKTSARRDRLITKEFESEVPVRCTLFVDASASVRLPSAGGKPVQRLAEIAAAVAQASAAARDLTGLCLFDENGVRVLARPDRSGPHLSRLLQILADAAALAPADARVDPALLLPSAYALAREVYPDQLRAEVNALPWLFKWFGGFPGHWRHRAGWLGALFRRKGRITLLLARDLPLLLSLSAVLLLVFLGDDGVTAAAAALLLSPVLVASALLFWPLATLLTIGQRRRARWRKHLAALLAARHGLLPGGVEALMEDEDALSLHLQRFLAEHQVPYVLPLYDEQGRFRFAAPQKVPVLAAALLRSVAHGHDNELFVLLADLLELDDQLGPLLKAVRVALGRHHQVLVVCPWPPGVPPPDEQEDEDAPPRPTATLREALEQATRRRFHGAFRRLRRTFGRLGVPVLCAAAGEAVPLILDRIDRLRVVGRRR
jgi:uncharacterized protein (DUF58 family)